MMPNKFYDPNTQVEWTTLWSAIKEDVGGWHKWFAWYPVKVGDQWQWLKFVYRKKWVNSLNSIDTMTEYGTLFDVLKEQHGN